MRAYDKLLKALRKDIIKDTPVIDGAILKDKAVSNAAKGLYMTMQTMQVSSLQEVLDGIGAYSKDNIDAVFEQLHELIEAGYISFDGKEQGK